MYLRYYVQLMNISG